MLTEQEKQTYLASRGGACPKCGSDWQEGEEVNVGAGEASQVMVCPQCDYAWVDVYKLVDVWECEE